MAPEVGKLSRLSAVLRAPEDGGPTESYLMPSSLYKSRDHIYCFSLDVLLLELLSVGGGGGMISEK